MIVCTPADKEDFAAQASAFEVETADHTSVAGEGFSDDVLRAVVRDCDAAADRIQGFLYGKRRVIRDVWKPYGFQVIWEARIEACTHDEFIERCRMERLRLVLAKHLTTDRCQTAQVEASNTDANTRNTGILPSHGDKR